MADTKTSALASLGTPVGADYVFGVLASGPTDKKLLLSDLRKYTSQSYIPGGRLTLESGVPVSTTDQTAKTTIYYTPYIHNLINLWDGANWAPTEFTETSLALGTITSAKPYDVFGYLSAGALVLELLAWTNDTTRATAVTLQDGRYCKSGDKTRLLLGTFYTTSTTTTADAEATRYLCNVYNTVAKKLAMAVTGTYTHTYTTATWREWNNGTGVTRMQFVVSVPASAVPASVLANLSGSVAAHGYFNLQVDGTDGSVCMTSTNYGGYGNSIVPVGVGVLASPGPGKHYATVVEYGYSGTTFFSADAITVAIC